MLVALGSSYYLPTLFNKDGPEIPSTYKQPDKSSDLSEIYQGTLPCADCSGLLTELTFKKNAPEASGGAYLLKETYQGKNDKPFEKEGNWIMTKGNTKNPNSIIYELDSDKPGQSSYYLKVDEKTIKMLDRNKNEIESPFDLSLTKIR